MAVSSENIRALFNSVQEEKDDLKELMDNAFEDLSRGTVEIKIGFCIFMFHTLSCGYINFFCEIFVAFYAVFPKLGKDLLKFIPEYGSYRIYLILVVTCFSESQVCTEIDCDKPMDIMCDDIAEIFAERLSLEIKWISEKNFDLISCALIAPKVGGVYYRQTLLP
jgi:hypothetical protein